MTRKEFKHILESEAHPCKRFLDKPVDHGHNLRSCKTNPAHLRIPVSRTVRHKQSFIPRGAKLNLIWYVYIICNVLNFCCNITVILIVKGNKQRYYYYYYNSITLCALWLHKNVGYARINKCIIEGFVKGIVRTVEDFVNLFFKEFDAQKQSVNIIKCTLMFSSTFSLFHRRTTEEVNKKRTKNVITKKEQFGVL